MFERLIIRCPKQDRSSRQGWDAFFPYYAGYPASFARSLISSANLDQGAVVLDPWNGSGTTINVASNLGYRSIGCDLNPVMVIVSRARCLRSADGDSIEPLMSKIVDRASKYRVELNPNDPLTGWFDIRAVEGIRCIEAVIREHLLGTWTLRPDGTHFECMSSLAATFYVALFLTCRSLVSNFQCSNPTWLRQRKTGEALIAVNRISIIKAFSQCLESMSRQLAVLKSGATEICEPGRIDVHLADSTKLKLPKNSVDFVLTSPPYCTRIDYTAATRIELAVLSPLLNRSPGDLSRSMIGSIRVPLEPIVQSSNWGKTCNRFLDTVRKHKSKASSGYYLNTHLDYFAKISSSINRIKMTMKTGGTAILVVQDSYYKDVHNNLPIIMTEICAFNGLRLIGSREFHLSRSMSGVNPYTRMYKRRAGAVEAVLCFTRD